MIYASKFTQRPPYYRGERRRPGRFRERLAKLAVVAVAVGLGLSVCLLGACGAMVGK